MDLVIIGKALQMPIISELNENLPAPFDDGSGLATENNMQVSFRIPPTSPVGYIELLSSPWNQDRVIIAALGNTPQGVAWAASGLYDAKIRSQLTGNFAVINDRQVTTTDTRLAPPESVSVVSTAQPDVIMIPPTLSQTPQTARPTWILPALIVSVSLTVLVILGALVGWIRHNLRRGRIKHVD